MKRHVKKLFISDRFLMMMVVVILLFANIVSSRADLKKQNAEKEKNKVSSSQDKDSKTKSGNLERTKTGASDSQIYINVLKKSTKKVERMPLEEYVIGAVAAEMPAEFLAEALKAQAVACRTYAARKISKKMVHQGYEKQKVYLCDDFSHCQAYIDKSQMKQRWGKNFDKYYKKIYSAVMSTKGEVLVYNGEIIDCLFHAASGGKTEDAKEVFGRTVSYLQSVVSRGEEACPKFSGEFYFGYDEFIKRLKSIYPNLKIDTKNISSQIKVLQRTSTQRVKTIKVGNITISGNSFRSIFGLYSTEFWIYPQARGIKIRTRGYGHGLGMSQWGANYLARQGKNYKEILFYYYKNVKLCRVK